jgi:hypothetical protein
MQTFNSLFEHELMKIIDEEIGELRNRLEVNTYSEIGQFRYVMGQISALRNVQNELIGIAKKAADQSNR